jgi:hypothetical protein
MRISAPISTIYGTPSLCVSGGVATVDKYNTEGQEDENKEEAHVE